MDAFSSYLGVKSRIIPTGTGKITSLVLREYYAWRLSLKNEETANTLSDLQAQCAEYAAILDIIGKMTMLSKKRDTVDRIKEIFVTVFGAGSFQYIDLDNNEPLSAERARVFSSLFPSRAKKRDDGNGFSIPISNKDRIYGVVESGDFLFPQYVDKYMSFATQIAKVCGLVFSNVEQYELLTDSQKELSYLSRHDSLTGLFNRTYVNEILDKGQKVDPPCTVFLMDVDRLKYVNDTFGHLIGDQIIQGAARILQRTFREQDIVARIGGDEFLAIVYGCDGPMAQTIVDRFRQISESFNDSIAEPHLQVSMSVGYSTAADTDNTLTGMIELADSLMYQEKNEKKRRRTTAD